MPEVTTITGEVEEKKKSYQDKAHADKWTLTINGERVSMLMPKQEAIDQGWDRGKAWEVAEMVMEGQWVKCGHEGSYKNIVSLEIIDRPVGAPAPGVGSDLRNRWIVYESLMSSATSLVKDHPFYAGIENPHKEVWKCVRDWIKGFEKAFRDTQEGM